MNLKEIIEILGEVYNKQLIIKKLTTKANIPMGCFVNYSISLYSLEGKPIKLIDYKECINYSNSQKEKSIKSAELKFLKQVIEYFKANEFRS